MPDREPDRIEAMSEAATAEYLRRSSMTYLECAIHLMATHMPVTEVARILREEADQVEEFE